MADRAFQLFPDGTKKIVYAEAFETHSQDESFLCCGLKGKCLAESTLHICGDTRDNYFSAKKHKRGCRFDESKGYGSRSHLDYEGYDFDMDVFAANFGDKDSKAAVNAKKGTDKKVAEEPTDEPGDGAKQFERTLRKPKSLKELYCVLVNNDPDTYYGKQLVRDCLCDSRTINDHLELGLNGYVLVECTKAQRPEWLPSGRTYLYLQTIQDDYNQRAAIILYCATKNLRNEIWEKKISSAPSGTHFVVFGYWRPIPGHPNAYEADVFQLKCIESLEDL